MSQWAERIRNHQVWQQMQSLGPIIAQAVARDGIDVTGIDGVERIRTVLAFIGKRLAAADPVTNYPAPLDGISSALQSAIAELQAFVGDGNTGHIANANANADAALT